MNKSYSTLYSPPQKTLLWLAYSPIHITQTKPPQTPKNFETKEQSSKTWRSQVPRGLRGKSKLKRGSLEITKVADSFARK